MGGGGRPRNGGRGRTKEWGRRKRWGRNKEEGRDKGWGKSRSKEGMDKQRGEGERRGRGIRKGIGSSGGCSSPSEGGGARWGAFVIVHVGTCGWWGGAGRIRHHACGHSWTVVGCWSPFFDRGCGALVVEQGALVVVHVRSLPCPGYSVWNPCGIHGIHQEFHMESIR